MKIVFIVPRFPKLSETFIVSKFQGLIELGYDVEVVCNLSPESEWSHFAQLESNPEYRRRVHITWPVRPRFIVLILWPLLLLQTLWRQPALTWRYWWKGWSRYGFDLLRRFYIDAQLIAARPDVIHFEFGALTQNRLYLRELLKCKVVASFRGYGLYLSGLEQDSYYQEIWEVADWLHLLGNAMWDHAQKRGCPPNKPHTLIPPAIDTKVFKVNNQHPNKKIGTNEHPIRVLSVGRLEWVKGYEYAMQAIKLVKDRGFAVDYRIIGQGSYLEPLAFCRQQLGLQQAITFVGSVSPDSVRDHLSNTDIFLHTAVSEGFCNAVIEAQAMQLPIVTSDPGGLPENVADGITGFVVPRRDPEALAERIIRLAKNPELRQQMGLAGRQRAVEHFDLKDHIQAFDRMYQAVCSTSDEQT